MAKETTGGDGGSLDVGCFVRGQVSAYGELLAEKTAEDLTISDRW